MSSRAQGIRRATVNHYLVREAGSTNRGAQERAIARHLVEESSGFAEFPEFFELPESYLPTEVDEVKLRKNLRIDLQSQDTVG